MSHPSNTVIEVLAALAHIVHPNQRHDDWEHVRKVIQDVQLLANMKNLDINSLKTKDVKNAKKIISNHDEAKAKNASGAIASIFNWVCNVIELFEVSHEVIDISPPKEEKPHHEKKHHSPKKEAHNEPKVEEGDPSNASERAHQILRTIKKQDITMIKTLNAPPPTIKQVMNAVLIMFRIKFVKVKGKAEGSDQWPVVQKMLADPHFLDNILNYDKDNVTHDIIVKANKQLDGESPEHTLKVSQAAYGLHNWVLALSEYFYERHPEMKEEESKEEEKPHLEKKTHSPKKEVHHKPKEEEHAPSSAIEKALSVL